MQDSAAIAATKRWLENMVIGHNLCPFAKKPYVSGKTRLVDCWHTKNKATLKQLEQELSLLQDTPSIETTLLVLGQGYRDYFRYLDLLDAANVLLANLGLEGELQLASFHPEYLFADEPELSTSHFTNRSPYPLIHFIREASITRVLKAYPDPDRIPENNILKMQQLGLAALQQSLADSRK